MGDFEDKLNAILSSPEAMNQIAALAQSLEGGGDTSEASSPSPPAPSAGDGGLGGLGNLSGLLGSVDPAMISRFLPLLGELSSGNQSQREQLLYALRPFLRESRREKIDQAIKIAKLIHVGKVFFTTLGDNDHV